MMKIQKIDPKRLKELRGKMSRQDLADKSSVSARQIARIEASTASATVRSHTVKRLASALGVDSEVLSGSKPADGAVRRHPSADKQLHLKIDSEVQLAYDLVEHSYPYSPGMKDIINWAPLFFVLLAEGSLAWRTRCLEKIDEAMKSLDVAATQQKHLYFTRYLTDVETGYWAEEDSIKKADICGETIRSDDSLMEFAGSNESFYGLNPFMAHLQKLSLEIEIKDKAFPVGIPGDPWDPFAYIYGFLKDELEEITGGSDNAEWALRFGDVRLSDIPEELMPGEEKDDHKNERVAWLEDRLSSESRAKLTLTI